MYILNQSGTAVYQSDAFETFCLVEKDDATLIVASRQWGDHPYTLGRYQWKEAREVLLSFYAALHDEYAYFDMPLSSYSSPEAAIRDKRVKRKGGS